MDAFAKLLLLAFAASLILFKSKSVVAREAKCAGRAILRLVLEDACLLETGMKG